MSSGQPAACGFFADAGECSALSWTPVNTQQHNHKVIHITQFHKVMNVGLTPWLMATGDYTVMDTTTSYLNDTRSRIFLALKLSLILCVTIFLILHSTVHRISTRGLFLPTLQWRCGSLRLYAITVAFSVVATRGSHAQTEVTVRVLDQHLRVYENPSSDITLPTFFH